MGWYSGNSGTNAHVVAQKQANALGIYDLLGNVEEWTQDFRIDNYTWLDAHETDPFHTQSEFFHLATEFTLRGGHYADGDAALRVSSRTSAAPGTRSNRRGFRLVRTLR